MAMTFLSHCRWRTIRRAPRPDGGLAKLGAGTLTLYATNTYTGPTTVSAARFSLASAATLPGYNVQNEVSVASGAALGVMPWNGSYGWTTAQISSLTTSASWAAGTAFGIDTTGGNSTYNGGVITTNGATANVAIPPGVGLAVLGPGTLTVAGANTYTGITLACEGTLKLANNLAIQDSPFDTNGAGVLDLSLVSTPTFGGLIGSNNLSVPGNVTALTLHLGSGVTQSFSGNLAGNMALNIAVSGTQVLAGSNTFTGPTSVNGGTLQIGNGGSGKGLTSSVTMSNNATIVFNHNDPLSYSGAISGSGQFIKLGTGNLDLVGSGTYSGPTTISAGTVELDGNGNNLPLATALSIASGGVLDMAGVPQTVGSLSGSAGAIVTNQYSEYPIPTLTVASSSGSTTFAGNIIGRNALALSGSGKLTLSGTNTYYGGTTVSGGTLDIAAPSALAGSGLVTIAAGGRLVLGSGAGIGALLAASSPVGSDAVALSAAAVPATLGGPESGYESMATLGGAPPLSQGGGESAVGGTAAAVPEPGTFALLAAGAAAAAAAVVRRKRKGC